MINRRDFIKTYSLAAGAILSPISLFANNQKMQMTEEYLCNFSATGTSLNIISNYEDDKKEFHSINGKTLNAKNYHTLSYQNHKDRLKTPLLKMKDGKYDKNGEFTPITWKEAFEIMSQKAKYALNESGADGVGLMTSGNISIDESYALIKLYKAGFRSNNIFNTAHYTSYPSMAACVAVYGMDSNNGDYQDIYYTDTLVSWGVNFAETFPSLLTKILNAQKNKKSTYKFINISTMQNQTSNFADLNIIIKPNSDLLLLNYIAHELVYNNENNLDWKILKQRTIFASIDTQDSNNADRFKQWEISYFEYKKSLEKYTLDYVANEIKLDEEDLESFKQKLKILAKHYINQTTKTTSVWSSGINKQKNAIDINIALHSMHLLLNKHSRPGCSALSLSGQVSSNGSAVEVGAFSNRLPANRYIKYKEHRVQTEAIWNIPETTLNSVASNDSMQVFKNIKNNITKFVWIVGANPYHSTPNLLSHVKDLKEKDDLFLVTSDCFNTISTSLSDMILPTATHHEKHSIYGTTNREIKVSKQYLTPNASSMSTLWQIFEFSKYFQARDHWGKVPLSNGQALSSVKHLIRAYGYKENDTLYRILFGNKRAKSFKLPSKDLNSSILNSEVKGDSRDIIGTEDTIFGGYRYYIQKYLFEEYRKFGRGRGYDLSSYDSYLTKPLKWPYLFNKSIYYRYNPIDDIYASKAATLKDKYIFYGKMGGKNLPYGGVEGIRDENKKELKYRAKIFAVNYKKTDKKNENFPFLLTSTKAIEHWNTGTITMNIKELENSLPMAYCYMNKDDMKSKSLQNQDLIMISSQVGKLQARVMFDKRFELPKGIISIGNFDENVLINKITNNINDTYVSVTKVLGEKNV